MADSGMPLALAQLWHGRGMPHLQAQSHGYRDLQAEKASGRGRLQDSTAISGELAGGLAGGVS